MVDRVKVLIGEKNGEELEYQEEYELIANNVPVVNSKIQEDNVDDALGRHQNNINLLSPLFFNFIDYGEVHTLMNFFAYDSTGNQEISYSPQTIDFDEISDTSNMTLFSMVNGEINISQGGLYNIAVTVATFQNYVKSHQIKCWLEKKTDNEWVTITGTDGYLSNNSEHVGENSAHIQTIQQFENNDKIRVKIWYMNQGYIDCMENGVDYDDDDFDEGSKFKPIYTLKNASSVKIIPIVSSEMHINFGRDNGELNSDNSIGISIDFGEL